MARGTRFLLFSCIFMLHVYMALAQNQDPIWVDNLQIRMVSTGLSENLPVGTVIGTARATDPEGGRITYNITSDPSILSIDSQTGVVTLIAPLDRERKSSYMVTVYAIDDHGNKLAHSYDARVTDENDNSPRFQVPSGGYSVEVGEDVPVSSTILGNIRVTDADLGTNSRVTFSCYVPERDEGRLTVEQARIACETFRVGTEMISDGVYVASIILDKRLDYDVTRSYSLTLAATDDGAPRSTSYTNVNINVRQRGDGIPRFLNVPVTVNIFEGINKDTEVGVLKVHDGDLGASKDLRIKIAQGEDGLGWFRLGRLERENVPLPQYTVPIYSNGNIDREAWDGVYEFDVEAIVLAGGKETSARARTTVRVTVRDRNDNGPTFVPQDNYDIIVQEGLTTGTKLPGLDLIIRDRDEGRNSEFALTLVDDTWGTFSLSPDRCTGECAVSLVVENSRSMDFEDGRYRTQIVRVVARETRTSEQRSSTGTVTVRLQDLNDNAPVFPQTQYRLSVREDRPVGYLVATIRATDADSGNFGTVRYSLVADDTPAALQWFDVNEVTGEIRLAKPLDFERQPTLSLTYEARDLGGRFNRVPFEVTVLNFNDQGPVFEKDNYDVTINEGTTQLRINITAVDQEQSRVVTYRIVSGNTPDNAFSISRFTGVISLRRPVSFEDTSGRGYFRLVVEASDGGTTPQTTTIPVTISVQNIANRRPRFNQAFYAGSVSEIAPSGQSVVTVRASDSDRGNNGQLRYQIGSGSFNNFNIDPTSGLIRVSPNANLDLQTGSPTYRMTVQAVDEGSPPLTAETQVTVTVTDANNKMPQFIQNVYLTSLLESAPVGTSILQLVADDPDSDRLLEYSIRRETVSAKDESGQNLNPSMLTNYRDTFSVDILSGIVQSQRMLSRDQVGEISFVAQVRDRNAQVPQVQTATATVIVTIESAKRQQLEFTPPLTSANPDIRVTVPEEEDVGYVVYNLVALDPNTNRPVQNYVKVSGTDPMNYFFVDQVRGRITLNRRLDYERLSNRDLSFQVRATTTGTPVLSAVARIIVTVRDVNDNSPVFRQSSYRFNIREGTQFSDDIGVMATDADSGEYSRIRYTLTGKGRQLFYIDPNTGSISVAPGVSLDREAIESGEFELLVKATDNPDGRSNDQRQTDVPLTIVVDDVNDNPPMFPVDQYNFYTRDNARAGTALGTVKATDADNINGNEGEITYTIASASIEDLFIIDRTTGVLRNLKDLTGYAKLLPYELRVQARDSGAPYLTSTVMVNVFISDLRGNDDIPHITSPSRDGQVFNVSEDAGAGTVVTKIIAVARGASASGTVSFKFLDNPLLRDQTYFRINPLTGEITLVKPLDRESQQQYQLIVVVENTLAATEIKRSLFVNVSDINDNIPSFLTCPGIHINPIVVQIKEEGPRVADIVQVKGCDLDGPPNNAVYYYIVKGNDPIPGQTTPPFSIDRSTGLIRTQVRLDREVSKEFMLYIKVSDNANLDVTNYVVNASLGSIQMVKVVVVDIDDNGPSFGKDMTFSTGVVATARFRTKLLKITAQDLDTQTPFARTIYSLDNTQFFREGDETRNTPDAFTIEAFSGQVMTNLPDYLDYQNGYFKMDVKAVGQGRSNQTVARSSTAQLFIYVIRGTQRLKFHFKLPPEMVAKTRGEFMRKVNQTLGDNIRINDDSIHYHTDENAIMDESATDLCFHMVRNNRVIQPDEALEILADNKNNLQPLYQEYSVSGPGLCMLKAVTYTWQDHWWLWWILIALTLLIMLISLIMICVICCCWKRPIAEPYVNLDPGIDYLPHKEYEWQQRTVRME